MDIRDIRSIGKKKRRLTEDEMEASHGAYLPTPKQIAAECAKIRAENEAARQGKKPQPEVDADCDVELEEAADRACR